ncbi:MAG: hypothetical protein ACYDAY_00365 [Candidatus Dormibacteria bacterium]
MGMTRSGRGLAALLAVVAVCAGQQLPAVHAGYWSQGTIGVDNTPAGLAADATTNRVYVTSMYSDTLTVVDGSTNHVVDDVAIGSGRHPWSVSLDTSRQLAYVVDYCTDSVSVVNVSALPATVVTEIAMPAVKSPFEAALDLTHGFAYVNGYESGNIGVLDLTARTLVATITLPPGSWPQSVAVDPVTQTVFASDDRLGVVHVVDGNARAWVRDIPLSGNPAGLYVDPSANLVYVALYSTSSMAVIDAAHSTVVATIGGLGSGSQLIAPGPSGELLTTNQGSGTVSVIDTGLRRVVQTIRAGSSPYGVDVNSATGIGYVSNQQANSVTVLGADDAPPWSSITTVSTPTSPVILKSLPSASIPKVQGVPLPPNADGFSDVVQGKAGDDSSGVSSVMVTFSLAAASNVTQLASATTFSVAAVVSCTNLTRTDCTWQASLAWRAPNFELAPGQYTAISVATDRAGNVEVPSAQPTTLLII